VTAEVAIAGSYAAALVGAAFVLELLSAHTHRRSLRFRTAGFTYDDENDHWVCPEGEHLWPHELDRERRLVRYRARPHVCNACDMKHRCTDSDEGREVVRPLDPWPHSEAGRFHRVIALSLVVLSAFIVSVELTRNHELVDVAALLGLLMVDAIAGSVLLRDLRRRPANFPEPSPSHGVRFRVPSRY
jgi:hypothetical protein